MTTTKSKNLPLAKRGLNFEMLMWLFTRLSALAMYGLILVAIIGALIGGKKGALIGAGAGVAAGAIITKKTKPKTIYYGY